ncbi:hypothetical protein [Ferruginibacter albus]|uniref:hypothetical protein n=1 Tax=Ferruginibacter albus TaxID=2875540 RepID=UPI001CC5B214|nr:hypothetical protein [Ferruginibacter albus]UAY51091.1 hypothetical protein K9M53_10870 [Ferruginibacter albus]
MRAYSTAVQEFITDFDLISSDGSVSFDAIVQFKVKEKTTQYKTTVQVVTIESKRTDAIYLFNKDIASDLFPNTFKNTKDNVYYIDERYLMIISDNASHGDFKAFIYPKVAINNASEVEDVSTFI